MSARKFPLAALLAVIGLVVSAFAFTTSASAVPSSYPPGQSTTLSANVSAVSAGGTLTVTGTHFKGLVTLRIGNVVVGTAMAGADGTFSTQITLPSDQFPPGSYTITATDAGGDKQTITVAVVTAAAVATTPGSGGGGGLPNTGVALISIGGLGLLLLLGGGLLLLTGRRRQAHS